MPYPSDNKPKKDDQPESIFPTIESALHTLHIYSLGLESTQFADFNFAARTGLARLQKQICMAGFNYIDKEDSRENNEQEKIIELIEGGIKEKRN